MAMTAGNPTSRKGRRRSAKSGLSAALFLKQHAAMKERLLEQEAELRVLRLQLQRRDGLQNEERSRLLKEIVILKRQSVEEAATAAKKLMIDTSKPRDASISAQNNFGALRAENAKLRQRIRQQAIAMRDANHQYCELQEKFNIAWESKLSIVMKKLENANASMHELGAWVDGIRIVGKANLRRDLVAANGRVKQLEEQLDKWKTKHEELQIKHDEMRDKLLKQSANQAIHLTEQAWGIVRTLHADVCDSISRSEARIDEANADLSALKEKEAAAIAALKAKFNAEIDCLQSENSALKVENAFSQKEIKRLDDKIRKGVLREEALLDRLAGGEKVTVLQGGRGIYTAHKAQIEETPDFGILNFPDWEKPAHRRSRHDRVKDASIRQAGRVARPMSARPPSHKRGHAR